MKNKWIILVGFFLFCFFPLSVNAASVSIAGTSATGVVGGTITVNVTLRESKGLGSWEFSIGYDSSLLEMTSGSGHVVDYVQGEGQTSKTYTYKFRVKKSGTATISVINTAIAAWDESLTSPTDSTTIRLIAQEEITASYSSNNNLKSLGVEGYDLNFNKDTLDYTIEVENDVTKVNIQAETEDSKASLSGTGEKDVHEGSNSFQVVVTAENGNTKTYTININVKELNPVKVTMNKKEYTVVRKKDELQDIIPKSFEETTVKIEEEEVLAFHSDVLNIDILALKDEEGKIFFYVYDDGKYELYEELTGGNLTIRLLDDTSDIPEGWKKTTLKIDDHTYTAYQLGDRSDFYLVYGQNVETGKKALYVYDSVDKTLQRYQNEAVEQLNSTLQLRTYILLGVLALVVILLIVLLCLLRNKANVKKRKKLKQEQKEFLK